MRIAETTGPSSGNAALCAKVAQTTLITAAIAFTLAMPARGLGQAADGHEARGHGHGHGEWHQRIKRSYRQYHYVSDPTVAPVPSDPSFCAAAPFDTNVYVEGTLTTYDTRWRDGVVRDHVRRPVGTARACVGVNDFAFTPFEGLADIYWELDIDNVGVFILDGKCVPSSNDIPEPGVVLGGCVMRIIDSPSPFVGGNAVEGGVTFNPMGLPGYELSSSFFTLHLISEGHRHPGGRR
jgi:hypothetical protein